jgi:hypothetical protein
MEENQDKTDLDKIKIVLNSFSYEDDRKKRYYYEHWGNSSCGFYLIAIYVFEIDKLNLPKYKGVGGLFQKVFYKINTFFKGGTPKNLIIMFTEGSIFDWESYYIINCKKSLIDEIKEKLINQNINRKIKLVSTNGIEEI